MALDMNDGGAITGYSTVASGLTHGALWSNYTSAPQDLVMAPVVATIPDSEFMATSGPAIVTSVSAGLSIWPAAMFAEQVPVRFAHSQLELTNYTR